jgi:hypothetical protein
MRRSRAHKRGDHSLCRRDRCDAAAVTFVTAEREDPAPGPDDFVSVVSAAFVVDDDPASAARRAVAEQLARQAASGSPAASRELLRLLGQTVNDQASAIRALSARLSTPVHTHCPACGEALPEVPKGGVQGGS